MMHELRLSRVAEKTLDELHKINPKLLGRLMAVLDKIAKDPFSSKALSGEHKDHYSERLGDYRIVFEIDQKTAVVYIKKIGHRKDIYR
jgi:mRNA interferase RelE/StbE